MPVILSPASAATVPATGMAPAPAAAAAPAAPDLQAARAQAEALDALLNEEFDVLRNRAFDQLEALQQRKIALLESLQATAAQVATLQTRPAEWAAILDIVEGSREAFRRNEALLARQVEVVRKTLRALQSADPTAAVDLYDRLGQMSRRGGKRLYSEA